MAQRLRFGPFEANLATGELCKHAVRLKLHDQPFQVLAMLVARPGELVTRQEIQQKLWPTGTFVDFENGLNSAVNRLRDVLGDSAEQPKFIETIPRKGYRFLKEVIIERPGVNGQKAENGPAASDRLTTTESSLNSFPAANRAKANWNRKLALAALVLSVMAIAPAMVRRSGAAPAASTIEAKLHPFPLVTYGDGEQWLPAFSPDGSRVAYSWATAIGWYLEVKPLGSDARMRLTRIPAHFPPGPTWSPDGRQIAFVRADALDDRGIFVVSPMGGPERKLRSLAPWRVPQRMVNWSPDGKWIVLSDEYKPESGRNSQNRGPNAIYVISPETLETRRLTSPGEKDFGDSTPIFSPDGTTIAFVHTTADSHDQICTIPADGGAPHVVVTEGLWTNGIAWTVDGKSLVFDRSFAGGFSIWRAPIAGGEIQRLDLSESRGNLLEPTLWKDRLAYEAHDSVQTVGLLALNGSKPVSPQTPLLSTRVDRVGRYSPKGDRIAFISDRTGADELWIADADGTNPIQLTHVEMPLVDLAWNPDGKSVAVSAAGGKVFLVSVYSGRSEVVFDGPAFTDEAAANLAFSRSGEYLYVVSQPGTGTAYELLKVPLSGGAPTKVLEGVITKVAESPDGSTLFYSRAESPENGAPPGIWRKPLGGAPEQFVAKAPGLWDITESGLYIQSDSNTLERYSFSGKRLQTVARLSRFGIKSPLSISPDGRSALIGYELRRIIEIDAVQGVN